MKKYFIPIALILISFALLVWQRFDLGPRTDVVVLASTSPHYLVGTHLRRGETIETRANEYVAIGLGEARVGLSERTSLELFRLYDDTRILKFPRGRIIVHNPTNQSIYIDTLKTQNNVTDATATFINFDFLQTVHIIPLYHSVETVLVDTKDSLILPIAIAVQETVPVSYEPISFERFNNTAVDFYTWFDKLFVSQ